MTLYSCTEDINETQHVFIIGSKSIGQYGGYETFVDRLIKQHQDENRIKYHIACKANGDGFMDESKLDSITNVVRDNTGKVREFSYFNAHVFKIPCPNIGPAVAIYYDRAAFNYSIRYCKEKGIAHPIFYVLTCRIGLFINGLVRQSRAIGGKFLLNPDGHEWKRAKWNSVIRRYWKWSEKRMVNVADLVICDSINIEKYIRTEYGVTATIYIAYGADIEKSTLANEDIKFQSWIEKNQLEPYKYYLIVGRFVPENNFETMIREFMVSHSEKKLAIVTNANDDFLNLLEKKLHFKSDDRIRFVGTVYDGELLKKIRECAYGYIHGHEVGGTNPSLLEALGSTSLNLLLDVGFNREVGQEAALYWKKTPGNLARLINEADEMDDRQRTKFESMARERIKNAYNWEAIGDKYKRVWLN